MARKGYLHAMLRHGLDVLDAAAEEVAAFEALPMTITFPGRPGVAPKTLPIEGYFDGNPSPHRHTAIGVKASLNAVLYVRENQAPAELTNMPLSQALPVGYRVTARGRQYRVTRAEFDRREYALLLSDENEAAG